MGTGVVAMTALAFSRSWPCLEYPALVLACANFLLFAVLLLPWALRWLRFRPEALADLNHPSQNAFFPTIAVALLVLSAQSVAFGFGSAFALALWWAGVGLTLVFNFVILFRLFNNPEVRPEQITAAHYIPAVGLVVIPVAGLPLLEQASGLAHDLALFMNLLGLGAGTLLYLGLFCLLFQRHYLNPPLSGRLVPTVWIQLAPIGWIPVNAMNLAETLRLPQALEAAKLFSLLVWGAGLWWLAMAALLTLAALRRGELRFSLAWWSFIFPLGALVTLSLNVYARTGFALARPCALALWLLLLALWAVTMGKTLRRVVSGAIFTA